MDTLMNNKILTIDEDLQNILGSKAIDFDLSELSRAREIGERLKATLGEKNNAAGLAAPQIGINRSVFIYSADRKPENLVLVINPVIKGVGEYTIDSWEACFSCMYADGRKSIAKMRRFENIWVSYITETGAHIETILESFAAKVFQHEYDHLRGYINIRHPQVLEVKNFGDEEAFEAFMTTVRTEDHKS